MVKPHIKFLSFREAELANNKVETMETFDHTSS